MTIKNLTIYKANDVVEAGYKLSLNEQRVILACIGQVNLGKELSSADEFELSARDFATLFSVADSTAYEALIDVAETLFNRYVVINNPDPNNPKIKQLKIRWISAIVYLPDEGKIRLCFAQYMLPYLSNLKNTFTRYKLEYIGKMTSVYAIRLYELLAQWQSVGKREVEIDWLKEQFQISGQYTEMHNFKKRVLDPAIKDINVHSNFNVSWTQRKTGRKVTHLTFIFEDKTTKPEKKKRATRKKFSAAEWTKFIETNARAGESWLEAATRLKNALDKEVT